MTIATRSDVGALAIVTTTATNAVSAQPKPLIASRQRQPDERSRSQWRTIPPWLIGERHEHPDRVQRDQGACVLPSKTTSKRDRDDAQDDDRPR